MHHEPDITIDPYQPRINEVKNYWWRVGNIEGLHADFANIRGTKSC